MQNILSGLDQVHLQQAGAVFAGEIVLISGILSRGRQFVSSRVGAEKWCARGAGSEQLADPCHHQTPPGFHLSLKVYQILSGYLNLLRFY